MSTATSPEDTIPPPPGTTTSSPASSVPLPPSSPLLGSSGMLGGDPASVTSPPPIGIERTISTTSLASQSSLSTSSPHQPAWPSRPSFENGSTRSLNVGSTTSVSASGSASTFGSSPAQPRGYRRPLNTHFSRSALNRQSVMCLGSIAHLQYYYARTGMLDGKGGHYAKSEPKSRNASFALTSQSTRSGHDSRIHPQRRTVSRASFGPARTGNTLAPGPMPLRSVSADCSGAFPPTWSTLSNTVTPAQNLSHSPELACSGNDETLLSVPDDRFCIEPDTDDIASYGQGDQYYPGEYHHEDEAGIEEVMLPPTVSTYNFPRRRIDPPPDLDTLRKRLMDALENCSALLELLASGESLSELDGTVGLQSTEAGVVPAHELPPVSPDQMPPPPSFPQDEPHSPALQSSEVNTSGLDRPPNRTVLEAALISETVLEATAAVRDYYLKHTRPEYLLSVTSTEKLRAEVVKTNGLVHRILDRAKDSDGEPIQASETGALQEWTYSMLDVLGRELEVERKANGARRERWKRWADDAEWEAKEGDPGQVARDRELKFLVCLLESDGDDGEAAEELSAAGWDTTAADSGNKPESQPSLSTPSQPGPDKMPDGPPPTEFLKLMQSGALLIRLHNAAVQASKNRTGRIDQLIINPDRPFRRAHNLRFWASAANSRWGIRVGEDAGAAMKLNAAEDVGTIARAVCAADESEAGAGTERREKIVAPVWKRFDEAVLAWSKAVRVQLMKEYAEAC